MPPRRRPIQHRRLDEVFEHDDDNPLKERIEQIVGERVEQMMEQMMEQLTERMANLLAERNRGHHLRDSNASFTDSDSEHTYDDIPQRQQRRRDDRRRPVQIDQGGDRRWESGIRTDIPEFEGSLQAEEFLDWLATAEEVLEFRGVPDDRRVSLISTRFRGRASAWWQQLKLTRNRMEKSKINSWEKLKKHLRSAFLPYNYQRIMYQRLQNLKQGFRTVDEYTAEFYQLLARNEIQETEDQLVARYIGGLKLQISEIVNMFDPISISAAHQRALMVERQSKRGGTTPFTNPFASARSNVIGSSAPRTSPIKQNTEKQQTPIFERGTSSNTKCFSCGEIGHRAVDCKKKWKENTFC